MNREYEVQLDITAMTRDVVTKLIESSPGVYVRFARWFHLRPGTGNVTIVTTHPSRPMRGIHVGKTTVKQAIEFLTGCIADDDMIVDWDKIAAKYNAGKGFAVGKGNGNKEYPHQAAMINGFGDNAKLKEILGVKKLFFVASEVIFSRDSDVRNKIDVVAHNGEGKVFFFEMKAPDNKRDDPVSQVNRYLRVYGKNGEKNSVFEAMLANYPQNPITQINEYVGIGMIGYSDNPRIENDMLIDCR